MKQLMRFSTDDINRARAIVNVFETSKPFGDFAAYAVLDDGAGVSYGISQFTHRSGALCEVIERYLDGGGTIARRIFQNILPVLKDRRARSIAKLADSDIFRNALKAAAITREMRAAQTAVSDLMYMHPAILECERLGLTLPLSLAVVYDSVVHGSWAAIRDTVKLPFPSAGGDEKKWIGEYVRRRHAWLTASPRLAKTAYRTRFFLTQIMAGRWNLDLPITVRGIRLTCENSYCGGDPLAHAQISAAEPAKDPSSNTAASPMTPIPQKPIDSSPKVPHTAQPPNSSYAREMLERVERSVYDAAREYDRADALIRAVTTRSDAAKSLWTTVAATIWQAAWAMVGFVYSVPPLIWLAAAVITATIALAYLYRQITLGKIREQNDAAVAKS
ncbi:MAG: chitosanase [Pyrinomonadaceae bacterium]